MFASFTESIVENAALTWFGGAGYVIGHVPHMACGELWVKAGVLTPV